MLGSPSKLVCMLVLGATACGSETPPPIDLPATTVVPTEAPAPQAPATTAPEEDEGPMFGPTVRGHLEIGTALSSDRRALSPAAVGRLLESRRAGFRACHEREMLQDRSLAGRLDLSFDVAIDGTIASCRVDETTLPSEAVGACVTGLVARLHVAPAPPRAVHVEVPFSFTPAD